MYDSFDEKIIKEHLQLAEKNGIDGFITTWWGIATNEDKIMPKLLHIAEKTKTKIAIYYETVAENKMVDTHLPFMSVEETTYRMISTYLLPNILFIKKGKNLTGI